LADRPDGSLPHFTLEILSGSPKESAEPDQFASDLGDPAGWPWDRACSPPARPMQPA